MKCSRVLEEKVLETKTVTFPLFLILYEEVLKTYSQAYFIRISLISSFLSQKWKSCQPWENGKESCIIIPQETERWEKKGV